MRSHCVTSNEYYTMSISMGRTDLHIRADHGKAHREPGLSVIGWSRLLHLIVFSALILLCSQLSEINDSNGGANDSSYDGNPEPGKVS